MERLDSTAVGVSLVAHVLLFTALALGRAKPPEVPPVMEVSYVEEAGLTSAAPEPAQAPAQGTAPETGPPEEAATEPERPLPDVRPVPQPAARTQPAPLERPTPAPPAQRSGAQQRQRSVASDPDFLKGIGRDPSTTRAQQAPAAMTGEARASINGAIARALRPCERQTLPAPEAAAIKVNVRVTLNPDGSLAEAAVSRVLNTNPGLAKYEQRMRDLALAIVRGCTTIRGLPAQYYDVPRGWRQFTYQFDPRSR